MISACEKNGVQFMDGVMWTHHKRTVLMKEHFNQLGDVRKVNGCFTVDDLPTDNIRLSKVTSSFSRDHLTHMYEIVGNRSVGCSGRFGMV